MEYEFIICLDTESKKVAKTFVDCFVKAFKDEREAIEEFEDEFETFKEEAGSLEICPWFSECLVDPYFSDLEKCLKKVAQINVNDEFKAEFFVHNCSSDYDNVHATFVYANNKLVVNYVNTESSLLFCEECDEDYENVIASIDKHYKGKKYKCPECGEILTFEETEDSREYIIEI